MLGGSTLSKIICISDIHIDNYQYFNPTEEEFNEMELQGEKNDYRLRQCLTFAGALCKYGAKNGINKLFLLGDIINKPRTSPKVFHTLKKFIETLSKQYYIYYILGQHDMDSKEMELDPENTYISAFDGPHLWYMHGKTIELDGLRMKFLNWVPKKEVDYSNCDIALGHLSLGLSQKPVGDYKLGIFGDIHNPIEIPHEFEDKIVGKDYSVGTPYQLYPSQPEKGVFGVLDTEKVEFSRVESDILLNI